MYATAFLIVAIVLFVLAVFGVDGRCQPAGLAFLAAALLMGVL